MNKKDTIEYDSLVPIAPGETLLEILEDRGISQAELAKRLDRPLKTINGIMKGRFAITPETALQLEQVLGLPASFWNKLESQFQETKLRIESQKHLERFVNDVKDYPFLEMVKNNWIESSINPLRKVEILLKFFGVTNFENIIEEEKLMVAFRISDKHTYSMPAIVSWIRKGSIDAENIKTETFDLEKLKALIPKLREFTLIEDPEKLMGILKEEFQKCGIAFVVTKGLKNAPINGATRWVSPSKALIQMSIRWKWADIFWFSLFHEIGHIIMDGKKEFHVDLKNRKIHNEKESEKDDFAKDLLIPPEQFDILVKEIKNKNGVEIYQYVRHFAKNINIHPGIVVGRLQHEKLIENNMNRFRIRFEWASNN